MQINKYSDYDSFSYVYNKYWAKDSLVFIPVLEKLALKYLDKDTNILDLCCGTGQISGELANQGFNVTGIDSSEEMIRFAKKNAPNVNFNVEDARTFNSAPTYELVISMYDSLNHIQDINQLELAFKNVFESLNNNGTFIFDLNMEEAYINNWVNHQSNIVEEDLICATRCSYNAKTKIGKFETTIFQYENVWQRNDIVLYQKCYSKEEICAKLNLAGFRQIKVYDARNDFNLNLIGRKFFVCIKTNNS